jgi:uncharacterized protein
MRVDVAFNAGGVTLRGWLYKPDRGTGPFPLVVMAHGFSALKEMGLDAYAQVFTAAGLAALVYDKKPGRKRRRAALRNRSSSPNA